MVAGAYLSSPSPPRAAERGEGRGGVLPPGGPRLVATHPTPTLPSLGSQALTGRGGGRMVRAATTNTKEYA